MSNAQWNIPDGTHSAPGDLERAGYAPLLCKVLRARNINTPQAAREYLRRDSGLISSPLLLKDMDRAADVINAAIRDNRKVAVYGDYDVDGITSCCMVCDYLTGRGLDCQVYIPDRLDEGYGMNCAAIQALAGRGVELIISVDCGITATAEAALARKLGIELIITDHHQCPAQLPDACAVIDPKRADSSYSFDTLAGVGVAFKLLCALEGDDRLILERYADLVAVGTVADVMPLVGENRALVYAGIEKLKNAPRLGFAALLEEAGAGQKPVTPNTISFVLAPRINAAGRLCHTQASVDLIMTDSPEVASDRAKELCRLNRCRQELETKVWDDAMSVLKDRRPTAPIVLKSDSWHPGVVGIAASRLAEAFCLPTIVICLDGDMGKGSCRSYGDFNLFDALTACGDHLESFGGHAFAAGLNIRAQEIDAFTAALEEYYRLHPTLVTDRLSPELCLEDLSDLDCDGIAALDALEPCGSGNPKPLMYAGDLSLESLGAIGSGKHLRLRVRSGEKLLECVFFGHGPADVTVREKDAVDLCFVPQINDFRSQKSPQLLVAGIRPSETGGLCRDILSGDAAAQGLLPHRPRREELGCVWRLLGQLGGQLTATLSELMDIASQRALSGPKLCLCLKILDQLGLVAISADSGAVTVRQIGGVKKTELDNSPLFRALWQGEAQQRV